jgi:hypothetical protein
MGVGGQRHALLASSPGSSPSTPCTGGWVDHGADLDRCEKSRLLWASNSETTNP